LVEKWIPPTRSETAEIGKKTEGILGVKVKTEFDHGEAHFGYLCALKVNNKKAEIDKIYDKVSCSF
jgi:hypothetical protein